MSEKLKSPKSPRNTQRESKEDPIGMLAEALLFGTNNAIERQEAQGQTELVRSEVLPTEFLGRVNTKEILEAAGVKFLGVVEDDPLFQYVELPQGWKKIPTEHSMHSTLLDNKGRARANIFYKAAFYDRSANLSLHTRYNYHFDYDKRDKEGIAVAYATDCDKVIHSTPPIKCDSRTPSYEYSDQASDKVEKWLDNNYPDWRNPGAYWGEDS